MLFRKAHDAGYEPEDDLQALDLAQVLFLHTRAHSGANIAINSHKYCCFPSLNDEGPHRTGS